ncbi:MAG: PEP-CTERM-box response regulator transcription factor [Rhodospirillaceae bacterium]|nr:PEP-CTERM-box response regulator transcription factor [Rhodospirillales bacterium]
MSKAKILVVEDDPGLRSQMKWSLSDYDVDVAADRVSALAAFERLAPPVVLLDLGLPPDADGASEGLATLQTILTQAPMTKVIITTGNEERTNALEAVALGAYDFHNKPIDPNLIRLVIDRALRLHDMEAENHRLSACQANSPLANNPLDGIIAASPAMLQVCRQVERVAGANVAVLITGESGTGKEVIARAIQRTSPRANKPFVALNCAAIPANLLESELFGHEKGAFTGAVRQTMGKVEQAHTGTLFLDEIGDMPVDLQAKLLRFLQNRTIERIGGRREIEVDVRIVSATNRNLEEAMVSGGFREDLYYRLNEVTIALPPLRDRPGDAVLLAKFFLTKHAEGLGRPPKGFAPDAIAAIAAYGWPGNIRELENRMRRAMLMADGKSITAADIALPGDGASADLPPLKDIREQAETQAVLRALALANNNVSAAAAMLGVSRPTLYGLMRQANINRKEAP